MGGGGGVGWVEGVSFFVFLFWELGVWDLGFGTCGIGWYDMLIYGFYLGLSWRLGGGVGMMGMILRL